jgi:hypothetical protein
MLGPFPTSFLFLCSGMFGLFALGELVFKETKCCDPLALWLPLGVSVVLGLLGVWGALP